MSTLRQKTMSMAFVLVAAEGYGSAARFRYENVTRRLISGRMARRRRRLGEELGPQPVGRVAKRPVAVHACGCLVQGAGVDVGRQDGHVPVRQVGDQARHGDRQRVRLLAAGAAGAPQAQLPFAVLASQQELRQDFALQHRERLTAAQEVRLADRQMPGQRLHLVGRQAGSGQAEIDERRGAAVTEVLRGPHQAALELGVALLGKCRPVQRPTRPLRAASCCGGMADISRKRRRR